MSWQFLFSLVFVLNGMERAISGKCCGYRIRYRIATDVLQSLGLNNRNTHC